MPKTPSLKIALPLLAFLIVGSASAADTYEVDKVHSSALFRVKHFSTSYFNGSFADLSGTIVFDPDNASNSSVNIEVQVDSVTVKSSRQSGHLKSPDFFNSAQFPVLTFKSTKFEKVDDDIYQVEGELTMRGITKSISATVEHVGGIEMRGTRRIGFSTSFDVNRRDFNINYGTDDIVGDSVKIILDIEAIEKK